MTILGIGVDTERVDRIARFVAAHPSELARVFTPRERSYCERVQSRRASRYAAVFAGKEAVLKALSTGWRADVEWSDVEISPEQCAPALLAGRIGRVAVALGVRRVLVSVAISRTIVVATACAEAAS